MAAIFKRVQMLLKPQQHRILQDTARQSGKSVAEVTRDVIDMGLEVMEKKKEFARREGALRKAQALRQSMRARRGRPMDVDVTSALHKIREGRDNDIIRSSY